MDQNNITIEMISPQDVSGLPGKHGIRIAGHTSAGFPSPAEVELRDIISFDDYLVPRPMSSFILRVSGDSMAGAGIVPDDLVIVERGRVPKNGDIVIAEIDGDWVMKYFLKKGGLITLEAANPRCQTIKPNMELRITGVVVACVRKYSL
jgi:repressor LexA